MICQFCGQHEATNRFLVNFMGSNSEVYICDECLENFKQYAGMPSLTNRHMDIANSQPSWPLGFSVQRANDREVRRSNQTNNKVGFNIDAANEIRTKRELNQLYKKLSNAVETEKFEEAAKLRDKINLIKNDFLKQPHDLGK